MARVSSVTSAGWAGSAPARSICRAPWGDGKAADAATRAVSARGIATDINALVLWATPTPIDLPTNVPWGLGHLANGAICRVPWGLSARAEASRQIDARAVPMQVLALAELIPWGMSVQAYSGQRIAGTGGLASVPRRSALTIQWGLQRAADVLSWVPWGMGRYVDAGVVVVIEPPDPDEPDATVIIPTLRAYIVINSASLTRISNNLALPITGLSISIDSDSAHWTWSATVPLRSFADLEPDTPGELVELEAVVNGFPWRLLVERKGEKERFDSGSLSIGGRGIAAELSDPTYPVVSHDNVSGAAMAQQLAAAALSINGVPLGWSLDWQAADWLVPAGAWVHSGTPLDAVVRIATAAGAYVQADPESRALRVVPRYPVAPWEWSGATPALVLPAAAVIERGTDHVNRAAYNVVYVSGQAGGVLARVKRSGSAGDRAAQMIVDGLITHADAARGRGLEVLGNTGAQQIVSLETGILPASGVIHVGTLMDWTRGTDSRRGLVRSLSVTASVPTGTSKDPVKVRQTIGVEIHG